MKLHHFMVIALSLAMTLLTCFMVYSSDTLSNYSQAKNLGEAVEIAKRQLENDGLPEYAALLTEEKVRDSIVTAIQSFEVLLQTEGGRQLEQKEFFLTKTKPVLEQITENDVWPEKCSFFWFTKLTLHDVTYDGLGLRLDVEISDGEYGGFALPILDIYYGRFSF